jgi:TatD DNase family protein
MTQSLQDGFDCHTHLDFPCFEPDREQVVTRARKAGVTRWTIAATEPKYWARVMRVARQTGGTPLLGIHPWWADTIEEHTLESTLNTLANHPGVCGIGEIGLDYHRAPPGPQRAHQQAVFRAQLALARERDWPVVIHCVRAWNDMLQILRSDGLAAVGGLLHGWAGSPQAVTETLNLNICLSFGSAIAHPYRKKARASLQATPLHQLCLETDSPDQPLPGQLRSEPAHLPQIAAIAADLKECSVEQLWKHCGENARSLWPAPSPANPHD